MDSARGGWHGHGRHGWSGPPGPPWGRSGPPPWVAGLFGLGAGRGEGGGPKVRRGDVRTAILDVLAGGPMNGYQVIGQIAERTQDAWRPSPGSVYPTVQQLEDEGLVEAVDQGGRRELRLTDAGHVWVAEHPDEIAATWRPFDGAGADGEPGDPHAGEGADLKRVIGQVMGAVWQVASTGTARQQAEAAEVLADTRRRLYGLLADPEEDA